jgi:hypothetical protein
VGRTWTPDFDFYPTLVDGRRASIVVDLDAPAEAPLAGHGALVTVRVAMLRPREDGLRDASELEPLGRLEDALVPAIERALDAVSVGRLMTNGVLVFYLYAPDGTDDTAAALALGAVDPGEYALRFAVAPDPEWRVLRDLLAPDPYALQGIWNRRLLRQFAAQGDDATAPREVDHLVVFAAEDAALAAAAALGALGFRVDPPEPDDEGQVRLQLHRDEVLTDGAPDAKIPDPHHAALRRLFEEHLLRTPDTGISNIQNWFSSLLQDAKGRGWWDATVAIDLWNEYQRQGIVAVAGPFPGIRFEFDVPEAAVTRRGRDILARTGASPHDPDRFIAAALAALGGDEPVVRRFVVEAVDAYNGGMFLSSAALLGFAAERVLRSLAADVHRALPEGSLRSQFQEKALKVAEGRRGDFLPRIGNVTDQIRRAIESGSLRLSSMRTPAPTCSACSRS